MIARARHPLQDGLPPAWAVAWGEDRYGAFAAFAVGPPGKPVEQRMRWIPPGTFLMGAPLSELGRWDDEGPQHEVTLTRGYWLGETPVTQALWVAVTGHNPSGFRGKRPDELERPVEQVSWDDCHQFLDLLNAQVAGLAARLPTEAEWERACRGGTATATWVDRSSNARASPDLDSIAWYERNSRSQMHSVGHKARRETHPVARKAPNPYGLHDMLGNVWEWCADAMRRYAAGPVTDPVGRQGQGPDRVVRGGSWYDDARCMRAAYRYARWGSDRYIHLGFRLAGGQESSLR